MVVSVLGRLFPASLRQRSFVVPLPQRRRREAWTFAIVGPSLITLGSRLLGSSVPPASVLFATLLLVVIVALIGGWRAALTAIAVGLLAQEVLYSFPYGSLNDRKPAQLSVLIAFGVIGALVGLMVDELSRLTEEQAALRRIAMLVATEADTDRLLGAVTVEVGQLLGVDFAGLGRYQSDGTITIAASWSRVDDHFPIALGWIGEGEKPEADLRSVVRTPITVEGRLWGTMIAASTIKRLHTTDAKARLARFTELVATAIANAESRADLADSRARIVAAADETRRRIERDLHDGVQQQLVSLGLELRTAQSAVPPELGKLEGELSRVADGLTNVLDELREFARGIHPATLADGGLEPALKGLARRSPVPVQLDMRAAARLSERIEVATYYVISETLTNAAKHAGASLVHVVVEITNNRIRVSVRDDGVGGADPSRGSGLVGLKDRVEALHGTITVQSPVGAGTSVHVDLPLEHPATG